MKKFIPYILIVAIISGFLLSVVPPPREAEAVIQIPIIGAVALWKLVAFAAASTAIVGGWSYFGGVAFLDMTFGNLLSFVGHFFYSIASIILTMSGYLVDWIIEKSIVKNEFIKDIPAIDAGWAVGRDLANLFFIFILLYIAIATILQISGYGIKDLLVKVIIIALLVNFSLMITKVIIDASNIMALEFYNGIKVETQAPADDPGGAFRKGDDIIVHNPSMVFMKYLKVQTIFQTEGQGIQGEIKAFEGDKEAINFKTSIIYFFGTIVLLVLAFVFFAIGFLFIIRTIALIFIMLLAPLAFLAMALPATKGYADKWWHALFSQSFFAPAVLFFIFLIAKIISSPEWIKITDTGDASFSSAFLGNPNHFVIIFSYILVIGLAIASLIVAKQMGAYGADTAMNWGKKLKGAGQGYAGRISKRYVGRAATAAEGALEKERESKIGRGFAKTLKAMPFLQRGLARTAQLTKKEVGKHEKQYEKYDLTTLEQLKGKFGTTREARTAMGKLIEKKRAQEAKKENVMKENARYTAVVGTKERNFEDGELPKAEKELAFTAPKGFVERYAETESRIETLRGEKTIEAENERAGLIVKRKKLEETKEKIDKLSAEKEKIEENRARRREIEALEESVAKVKVEAGAGEKKKEEKKT